jgi:protein subunit release factor A
MPATTGPEMRKFLNNEEIVGASESLERLAGEVRAAMLEVDPKARKDVILEVGAGDAAAILHCADKAIK